MIAWRFGFAPLGARANSANMALALDFSDAPDTGSTAFDVPAGPFGVAGGFCVPTGELGVLSEAMSDTAVQRRAEHEQELEELRQLGRSHGF